MARNKKPLVVVTRSIPDAGLDLLKGHFDLKITPKTRALSQQELLNFVKGADAILCVLKDKIDKKVLEAAGKQLKIVANYAVGFDNIDLVAARKRKVIVTNAPNVSIEAVAEHTFALLLAVARRILEADIFVRTGKYQGWEPGLLLGQELFGKVLGILGMGRIGRRVAKIGALGFGMKVIYYDLGQKIREMDQKIGSKDVTIRKLLTSSDFISLHVPLTSRTRHLVGKTELLSMKKTAVLINTSRGPVVNERALVWALKNGVIAGAGIDVFEFEPKIASGLLELDNVVMTPHIASATVEAREAMAKLAVENIIAVLGGRSPLTLASL